MKTKSGYLKNLSNVELPNADLVLYAFDRANDFSTHAQKLANQFPNAEVIGFSTAGHFIDEVINDEEVVFSAIDFDSSKVNCVSYQIKDFESSSELGAKIGQDFDTISNLKGIAIISDGGLVNGTDLIRNINENTKDSTPVFGGMAGDQARFEATYTGLNEAPTAGNVIVIGFVGDHLEINTGCKDGWNPMGVEFTITKSETNVLMELDNKNAYDTLHGLLEPADNAEFNKNTLYYPFKLDVSENDSIIRTPIFVDHENKTITYAGNMPEGKKVSLMRTKTMDLLDSTMEASKKAYNDTKSENFVFAVSCVGRRVVLDEMANEEYAEIKNVFSDLSNVLGFYSYGEFSRTETGNKHCLLHNQTFTIASISENIN